MQHKPIIMFLGEMWLSIQSEFIPFSILLLAMKLKTTYWRPRRPTDQRRSWHWSPDALQTRGRHGTGLTGLLDAPAAPALSHSQRIHCLKTPARTWVSILRLIKSQQEAYRTHA